MTDICDNMSCNFKRPDYTLSISKNTLRNNSTTSVSNNTSITSLKITERTRRKNKLKQDPTRNITSQNKTFLKNSKKEIFYFVTDFNSVRRAEK
jgi:hypothetical protein